MGIYKIKVSGLEPKYVRAEDTKKAITILWGILGRNTGYWENITEFRKAASIYPIDDLEGITILNETESEKFKRLMKNCFIDCIKSGEIKISIENGYDDSILYHELRVAVEGKTIYRQELPSLR